MGAVGVPSGAALAQRGAGLTEGSPLLFHWVPLASSLLQHRDDTEPGRDTLPALGSAPTALPLTV